VSGEVIKPGRGAGHRAAAMGGGEPVKVGHEQGPQCGGCIAHALLKALPQQASRVHRLLKKHSEVKQHLAGGVGGAAVVAAGFHPAVPRRAGG
jgi:hypothetical protein